MLEPGAVRVLERDRKQPVAGEPPKRLPREPVAGLLALSEFTRDRSEVSRDGVPRQPADVLDVLWQKHVVPDALGGPFEVSGHRPTASKEL
jgi:hypothetical protein